MDPLGVYSQPQLPYDYTAGSKWMLWLGLAAWGFALLLLSLGTILSEAPPVYGAICLLGAGFNLASSLLLGLLLVLRVISNQAGWRPLRVVVIRMLPSFAMILLLLVVDPLSARAQRAPVTVAVSNAFQIVAACKGYALDHDGEFPPSLDALIPNYLADRKSLNSPMGGNDANGIGFDYYPYKETDPPNKVVLRSRAVLHGLRVIARMNGGARLEKE
ncbi:MAG: hypothetical protein QM796_06620 [Chthoniobacteraceae bacterium]